MIVGSRHFLFTHRHACFVRSAYGARLRSELAQLGVVVELEERSGAAEAAVVPMLRSCKVVSEAEVGLEERCCCWGPAGGRVCAAASAEYPTPFAAQVATLALRTFISVSRDRKAIIYRFLGAPLVQASRRNSNSNTNTNTASWGH